MKRKIIITLIIIGIFLLVWLNEETNGLIAALILGALTLYMIVVAFSSAFTSTPVKSAGEENKEKS
jgi:amino acid permease